MGIDLSGEGIFYVLRNEDFARYLRDLFSTHYLQMKLQFGMFHDAEDPEELLGAIIERIQIADPSLVVTSWCSVPGEKIVEACIDLGLPFLVWTVAPQFAKGQLFKFLPSDYLENHHLIMRHLVLDKNLPSDWLVTQCVMRMVHAKTMGDF